MSWPSKLLSDTTIFWKPKKKQRETWIPWETIRLGC